jgi:hypothetical protein
MTNALLQLQAVGMHLYQAFCIAIDHRFEGRRRQTCRHYEPITSTTQPMVTRIGKRDRISENQAGCYQSSLRWFPWRSLPPHSALRTRKQG